MTRSTKSIKALAKQGFAIESMGEFGFGLVIDESSKIQSENLECLQAIADITFAQIFCDVLDHELPLILEVMPSLKVLRLESCESTTDGIADAWGNSKDLVELELREAMLSDIFLKTNNLPSSIRSLSLNGSQVSDHGIRAAISQFKDLRWLSVKRTNLTDKSVSELSKVKSLAGVDLDGCKAISDKVFAHLAKFKKLQLVNLAGTDVSVGRTEKFASANPECLVICDSNSVRRMLNEENWDEESFSKYTCVV